MKKILVFICLALSMLLLVCSCGGGNDTDTDTSANSDTQASTNTDTSTDSSTDTDTGVDVNDGKYRVFVCDENGKGIAGAWVQICNPQACVPVETDANGYIDVPSSDYHVQRVDDVSGLYESVVYEENEPHFEGDSKLITIVLKTK